MCDQLVTYMALFSIRTAQDLGIAIRDRRKALGIDQATLAGRVGVSRKWIIDIEKGKPRASVELVLRTLDILGFQFVTRSEEHHKPGSSDLDAVFDALKRHDT